MITLLKQEIKLKGKKTLAIECAVLFGGCFMSVTVLYLPLFIEGLK
mgnify:CR=1 FL=1